MPKWTQEGYLVVIFQDIKILPGERGSVERFIAHHNADIDALTAEREELQRRLDAVVAEVYVALLDRCYCEEVDDEDFDEQEQCEYCLRIAKLRAIAEGREG